MRRVLALAFLLVVAGVCAAPARAQDGGSRQTSAPAESRYEIIVANARLKAVVKLDKYTGDSFELARNKALTRNKDEEHAWQRIKRMPHPQEGEAVSNEVNYQIYTDGQSGIYTYLVNVKTGATWILTREEGKEELHWYPLRHQ